jgi:hypothetical protein
MAVRRPNPYRVKLHYSYAVNELAALLGVHKNTVRHWQNAGLRPVDSSRPLLFNGEVVRDFLFRRHKGRKCPCSPGTLYCMRCRQPRAPAAGLVEYRPLKPNSGNLRAICDTCESVMHRRVREADIAKVMPGCRVQFAEGVASLIGQVGPSLNCDE